MEPLRAKRHKVKFKPRFFFAIALAREKGIKFIVVLRRSNFFFLRGEEFERTF